MKSKEEILNTVIDTYAGGVYKDSRMSAVAYNMAIEAINVALNQSATLHPPHTEAWFEVPCSERLPEKQGHYFVILENGALFDSFYNTAIGWVIPPVEESKAAIWLEKRPVRPVRPVAEPNFQNRINDWMQECFGPEISKDKIERNHRFLEEALELVQSLGCTQSESHQLVDYVFSRPVGEPVQEVGGVMVTLAALCLANDLDMQDAGETEYQRISVPEIIQKIRRKQAAKPQHSPLPVAALPVNGVDAEALAIDTFPVYPIDKDFLKRIDWEQYIEYLRNSFIAGYNAASLPVNVGYTKEDIENAVNELSKQSTAPDKETPDWMKSDIRRGIYWGLGNKGYSKKDIYKILKLIQDKGLTTTPHTHSWVSVHKKEIDKIISSLPAPVDVPTPATPPH